MNCASHNPLVTIAVPTYQRPDLLRRALESIAQQTYRNLEVLVVDNASDGSGTEAVVNSFYGRLPGLKYERHATNIGAIGNFFYCLERAGSSLFMWLADDDELSPSCVEAMVEVLDRNPDAVTAAPYWLLIDNTQHRKQMPMCCYVQGSWLSRAMSFAWEANDSFFYGLHRTEVLRQARKVDYWWPNKGVLSNWAYPFLLDMVIAGKIIPVGRHDAQWINHEYTDKSYSLGGRRIRDKLIGAARRLNVHMIYAAKVYDRGGILAALSMMIASSCSLARGLCRLLKKFTP